MVKFITLAGKKQTGKDTSASIISKLLTERGYNVYITHFADSLKDACSHIFGIDRADMDTEAGKSKLTDIQWPVAQRDASSDTILGYKPAHLPTVSSMMTVRELLQFVGTDLFRNQMDGDIWVKSIYRKKYNYGDVVLVADCRFPNEADFARKCGLLFKVERDNKLGGDTHISEKALDNYPNFDLIVDNNSDIAHLESKWVEILKHCNFII
jgi:hypothetical protein